MPAIRKGEKRTQYIKRAIPYLMKNEGLSQRAAAGKAEGMYDQHLKNQKGKK